jgi:hypothetical protein
MRRQVDWYAMRRQIKGMVGSPRSRRIPSLVAAVKHKFRKRLVGERTGRERIVGYIVGRVTIGAVSSMVAYAST